MSDPAIDKQEFRRALGAFVTGVTIVTARDEKGWPVGLTANSFNSVSLDPPLVLWSLALDSRNLPAFRQAKTWAVHILAAGQEDLSTRFASSGQDKFAGLEIRDGPEGAPFLSGCAARFACRATFEYEGGDHASFVGQVLHLVVSPAGPLIYHGGKYGKVMPPGSGRARAEIANDGQFARQFVGHLLGRAHHAALEDVRREYHERGLRSSEYTVIASLGLGEGCTRLELVERAARGGVQLPQRPIDDLIECGYIRPDGDTLHLTVRGRTVLTELVAVAQASQLRLESRLSEQEMSLLVNFLERISNVASTTDSA